MGRHRHDQMVGSGCTRRADTEPAVPRAAGELARYLESRELRLAGALGDYLEDVANKTILDYWFKIAPLMHHELRLDNVQLPATTMTADFFEIGAMRGARLAEFVGLIAGAAASPRVQELFPTRWRRRKRSSVRPSAASSRRSKNCRRQGNSGADARNSPGGMEAVLRRLYTPAQRLAGQSRGARRPGFGEANRAGFGSPRAD